jgi:hypothetical protein
VSVGAYDCFSRRLLPATPAPRFNSGCTQCLEDHGMGKYFLAWLLGVPATVLVIVYLVMHI